MRTLIIGCGAIGGTLAACATRAGMEMAAVTGNPAIAAAIERHGYRVDDHGGPSWSVAARGPVTSTVEGLPEGRFDLCVVATQSAALEAALTAARARLTENATVVVCQNGLPEARAAKLVGERRVLGAVVGWGASMIEPGRYQRTSRGFLSLGRPFAASPDPAAARAVLEAASPVQVPPDLAAIRWSKLAINCATTTLGAVGGDRLGPLLRHRFVRRLALEIFAEVADVARAEGIHPAPLAGTLDIERVAITPAERRARLGTPVLLRKHAIVLAVGFKYRRLRSSMLYAIEKGRPPEIDHLNGEVARRGLARGVPTPVNAALVAAVRRVVEGRDRADGVRSSLALLREVYDQTVAGTAETALRDAA